VIVLPYRVGATDGAGAIGLAYPPVAGAGAGGAAAPPDDPTNLAIALNAGVQLELTWDAPVGGEPVDVYAIYRSANGGAFSELSTSVGTSYDDGAVAVGSTYAYKVLARNDQGDSGFTSTVSYGPLATMELSASVSAAPFPTVSLTWTATGVMGETNFLVQRRDVTNDDPFATIDTAAANTGSYFDAGPFTSRHRYAYQIVVNGGPSDGHVSNFIEVFGGDWAFGRFLRLGRRRARFF